MITSDPAKRAHQGTGASTCQVSLKPYNPGIVVPRLCPFLRCDPCDLNDADFPANCIVSIGATVTGEMMVGWPSGALISTCCILRRHTHSHPTPPERAAQASTTATPVSGSHLHTSS